MRIQPRAWGLHGIRPRALVPVLLSILLASPVLGLASAGGSVPADSSAYNNGEILVRFPTASPSVELVQDSNPSVNSILSISHVLELAPLNSTHPLVVLAADPSSSSPFNVSQSEGVGQFDLGLNGTLGVRYAGFALWAGPNLESIAANPAKGQAHLALSYHLLPPSHNSQGVSLNWSIENWPWLTSSDLLGLELQFSVPNGTGFSSCLGNGGSPSCAGSALAPGGIVWSSASNGSVGAAAAAGARVTVSWNSTATTAAHRVGVTAGTFYASSAVDRVTLAIPAGGNSVVNGSARFLLTLPAPALPAVLSGSPVVYAGVLAGAAALVLVAVGLRRRRDRRLVDWL
jgi:hypothetical protein